MEEEIAVGPRRERKRGPRTDKEDVSLLVLYLSTFVYGSLRVRVPNVFIALTVGVRLETVLLDEGVENTQILLDEEIGIR